MVQQIKEHKVGDSGTVLGALLEPGDIIRPKDLHVEDGKGWVAYGVPVEGKCYNPNMGPVVRPKDVIDRLKRF